MSRVIELQRPRGVTQLEVTKSERFSGGGREPKYLIDGELKSGRRVNLIEREDEEGFYEHNWRVFKRAGLPVVPTLRRGINGNIFVTDIKRDGSEVYGKGLQFTIDSSESRERPRPEVDRIFTSLIDSPELILIEKRVNKCIDIATTNEIFLPLDDPFELVVRPDGSWEVMLLDIIQGRRMFTHLTGLADGIANNELQGEWFLEHLKYLAYKLKLIR